MSGTFTESVDNEVELETNRLLLRGAVQGDAEYLHDMFKDPETMTYWSEAPHPDMERTKEFITGMMNANANGTTDFVICLKPDLKPIGKIGVWKGEEIGFILDRSQWGRGFAIEAMNKIVPYLFDVRNLESIRSDIDPRNKASLGLLKKFGFEEEGYEENTFYIGDEWVDSLYLRLTKEQWIRHRSS